ncbi:hypothetical protein N7523_005678 [Penicillium sp. IBT 18751x]|nr:hypothetical protein N7523_005678 [Penicillium sp. IBT 18751x]
MAVDTEGALAEKPAGIRFEPSSATSAVCDVDARPSAVTLKTWVVCCILSCGYGLSFWPVPVVSVIGTFIAADMGDPSGYIWFVPAWTISITCAFLIFGPNTDLLGRRWFLVLGNLTCFLGHIIVGSAQTTGQVIAGLAVSGFGGANCQMAAFAVPELLPNKWRHIGVVMADFTVYIAVIVGPVAAFFAYRLGHWAWNFWGVGIFQGLSFLGLLFLYYPPQNPYERPRRATRFSRADSLLRGGVPLLEALKSLDYLGAFLFVGGAVPFLMGIVWAGVHPSNDVHVVVPLVIGAAVLVMFVLWETFGNPRYPLTPTHIFSSSHGRDFTAPAVVLGVVNMFYYSSSILWPQMITVFYTNGGADWKESITLSLPQGFAILLGAILLTLFGSRIRHWQWQLTGSVFVMVVFGGLLGLVTPTNKGKMIAFMFLSQTGFGWALYLSIAMTQMGVQHGDLGVSGGIAGCIRFGAGAVATSIYQTIYHSSLTKYKNQYIPSAAMAAGLPESQVTALMAAVSEGTTALSVYGPAIAADAEAALSEAYCKAIFMVAMVSMAFGILGLAACLCCKDVDPKMTNKASTRTQLSLQRSGYRS